MSQITLDNRQAKILTDANDRVEIRDEPGVLLGYVAPVWTPADIVQAKRALASDQPRYTTEEVLSYLESLNRK